MRLMAPSRAPWRTVVSASFALAAACGPGGTPRDAGMPPRDAPTSDGTPSDGTPSDTSETPDTALVAPDGGADEAPGEDAPAPPLDADEPPDSAAPLDAPAPPPDAPAPLDAPTPPPDARAEAAVDARSDAAPRPDVSTPGDASTPTDASMPTGADDPPVAHDDSAHTGTGEAITLASVLANDTDADTGDTLTVASNTAPANGTLTAMGAGVFRYTPRAGFVGEDSFRYTVQDRAGLTDTGTVRIYVARARYYVSPTGSDTAAGTTPDTAWRSLARVQMGASSYGPGTSVLFARGGTYRATATLALRVNGTASEPFVLGAYGTGAAPVLSGSRPVTGWTRHAGMVFRASITDGGGVNDLYIDGVRQTLARHPNTGYLRNDSGSGTHLTDSELTQADGFFVGARLRIRSINWVYDIRPVTAYTRGRLSWTTALSNNIGTDDWGYFLDGALALLDAPGEWFFDAATNTLYLRPPGDRDPNTLSIEAARRVGDGSTDTEGVRLGGNYEVLDGLTLQHFVGPEQNTLAATPNAPPQHTGSALSVSYLNHHVTVRNSTIRLANYAARVFADDVTFEDNVIEQTFSTGLWGGGARIQLLRNRLREIATVPGHGEDSWGYMAVRFSGTATVMRHNTLDRVGYIGLLSGGSFSGCTYTPATNAVIEENYVANTMAVLNDGGPLSFDMVDGLIVRRNIAIHAIGNLDTQATRTVSLPTTSLGFGIYFGDKSITNTRVEDNTIADCVSGVFIDHTWRSRGNQVLRNTFFDTRTGIVWSDQSMFQCPGSMGLCNTRFDDTVRDNLVFSTVPGARSLQIDDVQCAAADGALRAGRWGTFDGNRYYTPQSGAPIYHKCFRGLCTTGEISLETWRMRSGADATSRTFTGAFRPSSTARAELLFNPYRSPRVVTFTGRRQTVEGVAVTSPLRLEPFTSVITLPAP